VFFYNEHGSESFAEQPESSLHGLLKQPQARIEANIRKLKILSKSQFPSNKSLTIAKNKHRENLKF